MAPRNDRTNRRADAPVAGGVPRADDGVPGAGPDAEEAALDATLLMSDREWLEHALGDLDSSAWTVPAVEL